MLNHELLDELYKGLALPRKKELLKLLFGESNQSMAYFRRGKDIMLSKAEIISDFFDIPIDTLRVDNRYEYDHRTKKMAVKGAAAASTPKAEPTTNPTELTELRLRNQYLEESLKLKEERIELLLEKIEMYKDKYEK